MERLTYRLVWFELEICPGKLRLAVIPGQPVLFGYEPDSGEKGKTILVPYEANEDLVDSLIESLDALVRSNKIFGTSPNAPERAFEGNAMSTPSIHIRIAYSNSRRWASVYTLKDAPPNVRTLVQQCRQLGLEVSRSVHLNAMSDEEATELVSPGGQAKARTPARVVARVKISLSGQIYLDGNPVGLDELSGALDRLTDEGGEVWYYRDHPEHEPSNEVRRVAESVLDRITSLGIPIKLSETDFG